MVATFTTIAKVKSRLKKFNTSISDTEVTEYIEQAEGLIKAVMKGNIPVTFDAAKHGLMERAATDLAAFNLLLYDPSSFSSVTEASFMADLIWTAIEEDLKHLGDKRVQDYLKVL